MIIKYKRSLQDGTCFEVEISENTSVEEFIKIEEVFDDLYDRKCHAQNLMYEREEKRRRSELEKKIKENPCYLCTDEDFCKEPCKGKKTCSKYKEYPF